MFCIVVYSLINLIMLAVSSLKHRQRSGGNLADGHTIPGSGLLLTIWPTPILPEAREAAQDRVYWRMFTKHSATHS